MKAISLWEPWATLVRVGAKRVETRSWATHYRGDLLICASKTGLPLVALLEFLSRPHFAASLAPAASGPTISPLDLHFGHAVCVVHLDGCERVEYLKSAMETERDFGDYSPGRYGWVLGNLRPVVPFRVTGHQDLFDVDVKEMRYEPHPPPPR